MGMQSIRKTVSLHDFAIGPIILLLFGIPVAIVIYVLVIVVLAVRLIREARTDNKATPNNPPSPYNTGYYRSQATVNSDETRKDV